MKLNEIFYLKHIAQKSNHVKMSSMLKQKRKASLKNLIHLIACCCYPPKVCNKETTAKRDCVKEEQNILHWWNCFSCLTYSLECATEHSLACVSVYYKIKFLSHLTFEPEKVLHKSKNFIVQERTNHILWELFYTKLMILFSDNLWHHLKKSWHYSCYHHRGVWVRAHVVLIPILELQYY